MSEHERSLEHSAKIRAYRALFGLLKTGLSFHIHRINAFLYFEKLIDRDTQRKADVEATLHAVGEHLRSNESVFHGFVAVLLEATDVGPHLVNKLTSCYEEQLKKATADPAGAAEEDVAVYQEQVNIMH